jgi:hypothetical protein
MTATGDRRANVGVGVLDGLGRRGAEKLLEQIRAAGDAEFLGQNAQRVFRCDKVDTGDALVGFKDAQCLTGKDCAGCAGNGEGEIQL